MPGGKPLQAMRFLPVTPSHSPTSPNLSAPKGGEGHAALMIDIEMCESDSLKGGEGLILRPRSNPISYRFSPSRRP